MKKKRGEQIKAATKPETQTSTLSDVYNIWVLCTVSHIVTIHVQQHPTGLIADKTEA